MASGEILNKEERFAAEVDAVRARVNNIAELYCGEDSVLGANEDRIEFQTSLLSGLSLQARIDVLNNYEKSLEVERENEAANFAYDKLRGTLIKPYSCLIEDVVRNVHQAPTPEVQEDTRVKEELLMKFPMSVRLQYWLESISKEIEASELRHTAERFVKSPVISTPSD